MVNVKSLASVSPRAVISESFAQYRFDAGAVTATRTDSDSAGATAGWATEDQEFSEADVQLESSRLVCFQWCAQEAMVLLAPDHN